MNCPACKSELPAGQERCPGCGAMVAPAVMGALAPDPARATPPARPRGAAVSSLRRRESSWKDEVRERVQKRRRHRAPGLPLFDAATGESAPAPEPSPDGARRLDQAELVTAPAPNAPEAIAPEAPPHEPLEQALGPTSLGEDLVPAEPAIEFDARIASEPDAVEHDLALRPEADAPALEPPILRDRYPAMRVAPEAAADEALPVDEEPEEEWAPHIEVAPRPVERPAAFGDRFEAAAVDTGVLLLLYATVVYFASRIAQAELSVLLVAWPWLLGYLAGLGLCYAAWFTGTTGQTPGKMLFGLRVVESDGRPPAYLRALARAALGALGSAALGLGCVPVFFDPARRALHDRLLRTRVVKS